MLVRSARFAALASLLLAGPAGRADDPPKFVPTAQYAERTIDGWTVRVNRRLLEGEHEALGREALDLLAAKLGEVSAAVPPVAVVELRKIPIWLGVNDGHAPCAEYHPSRAWLVEHGYNPDKARCVEIGNARRFVEWSKDQPSMVLHELAHGYHDRVLGQGHGQAEVAAAYRRARAGGTYDEVRHVDGRLHKAYALENPQEFFAELSEAYFGVNDFYPFRRAELERHDPESAALLERLWAQRAGAAAR